MRQPSQRSLSQCLQRRRSAGMTMCAKAIFNLVRSYCNWWVLMHSQELSRDSWARLVMNDLSAKLSKSTGEESHLGASCSTDWAVARSSIVWSNCHFSVSKSTLQECFASWIAQSLGRRSNPTSSGQLAFDSRLAGNLSEPNGRH